MHHNVQDAAKHKFNVVVTGLPEGAQHGNDSSEDCEAFLVSFLRKI